MTLDLNRDSKIPTDNCLYQCGGCRNCQPLTDYSTTSADGSTRIVLRDLESNLIEEIEGADIVLGCVAWLTSMPILAALAERDAVSIVVQKEDFLRPDLGSPGRWAATLRNAYRRLPDMERHTLRGLVGALSMCSDPTLDAVRCVGNHNKDRAPAFPRSHHKFVVFCRWETITIECGHALAGAFGMQYCQNPCTDRELRPYRVWTGSFNFTANAVRSFENAVVMDDPAIVDAYFNEYSQIVGISEPLDWRTTWSEPQWRIGT